MAQPSIASYFTSRKRAAVDEISSTRNKVRLLDSDASQINQDCGYKAKAILLKTIDNQQVTKNKSVDVKRSRIVTKLNFDSPKADGVKTPIRKTSSRSKNVATYKPQKQQNCIFTQLGSLSPTKRILPAKEQTVETIHKNNDTLSNNNNIPNIKEKTIEPSVSEAPKNAKKETTTLSAICAKTEVKDMSLAEIKAKLTRSSRLEELKSRINKFNEGIKKIEEKRLQKVEVPTLKEFKSIDLVVTTRYGKTIISNNNIY